VGKEEAKTILLNLGIESTRRLDRLSFSERKYLTISGLFCIHNALLFDYFGIDAMNLGLIDTLIKAEIDKGKCAIGFDNLQYMDTFEPFENIERMIINKAPTIK
jgi:hypothetical protein